MGLRDEIRQHVTFEIACLKNLLATNVLKSNFGIVAAARDAYSRRVDENLNRELDEEPQKFTCTTIIVHNEAGTSVPGMISRWPRVSLHAQKGLPWWCPWCLPFQLTLTI